MKYLKRFFRLKNILALVVLVLIGGFSFFYLSQKYVENKSIGKHFDAIADIPSNSVGMVLGCNKFVGSGINLFYKYRIKAAADLFKSGKVKHLIVSGDNGNKSYDEPTTMMKDLVAQGVPENAITLDYAGFRTLDSVIRCNVIFGQQKFTVISQKFHNERAIVIAESKGLNVIGYNAKSPSGPSAKATYKREKFARVKMVLDLLFGKEPKFYGDRIKLPV